MAHREWFLANHGSTRWAPEFRNFLEFAGRGFEIDYRHSPLNVPLSEGERAYHDAELARAPQFPNYY